MPHDVSSNEVGPGLPSDEQVERPGARPGARSGLRPGTQLLVAILVLAVAVALRLWRLDGQSLWYDEAYSITVSGLPFAECVEALVADVRQAPLHFALLAGWLELFGTGVLQARLLSVLASTAGLGFAWLLARRLFGPATALVTVALVATSQLDVLYAQEARMYALYAALATAGSWLFARAVLGGDARAWWGSAVLAALATATHYYAVLVVLAWVVFALSVRRSHPVPRARWIGAVVVFGALLAPWAIVGAARQASRVGLVVPERVAPWFAVGPTTALRTLNELNGGQLPRIHEPPAYWAWLTGAVLLGVPAVLGALRGRRTPSEREATRLCVLLVVVPLGAALLFGALFRFQYATRYVLPCLAPYLALAARGIVSLRPVPRRVTALAGAVVWGLAGVGTSALTVHKVQWREALARVAGERADGERCVFLPGERPPLEWGLYHPELDPRSTSLEAALEDEACPGVWVVAFERTPAHVEDAVRARRVLARSFTQTEETELFRIRVSHLERRPEPR